VNVIGQCANDVTKKLKIFFIDVFGNKKSRKRSHACVFTLTSLILLFIIFILFCCYYYCLCVCVCVCLYTKVIDILVELISGKGAFPTCLCHRVFKI
jgi:hypothetical protein